MNKTPELLPCPFCRGEAKIKRVTGSINYRYVKCSSCGARTKEWFGVDVAVTNWNTRVYPEEVQKAVISQTPRLVTVLKTERGGKNFFCPACANDVHFTYSHCTCCGQRLDWSEDES